MLVISKATRTYAFAALAAAGGWRCACGTMCRPGGPFHVRFCFTSISIPNWEPVTASLSPIQIPNRPRPHPQQTLGEPRQFPPKCVWPMLKPNEGPRDRVAGETCCPLANTSMPRASVAGGIYVRIHDCCCRLHECAPCATFWP